MMAHDAQRPAWAKVDDSGFGASAGYAEQAGIGVQFIIADLTTTRQSVNMPSGAKVVLISYRLLPGATATANQYAKYVVNAASDADATGKLATDGAYTPLFQGDDHVLSFAPGSECTRLDIITAAAVGSEKTVVSIRGVV